MVKPISPYLQRPLRSLEQALRELGQDETGRASGEPSPPPPPVAPAPPKPATAKDSVTIAGVDVPVEAGEREPPATGGQLDVTA